MAPFSGTSQFALHKRWPEPAMPPPSTPTKDTLSEEGLILESWTQGYNVGSLIILILIIFCNYRSGIWLHKLILLELILAIWHGTFIFFPDPRYGWYLSSTATLLFISYFLHNVVSWLKLRPFLPLWGSRLFIISLLLVQPFWIAEAWSNFAYFNGLGSNVNVRMRPWEALLRDPWWIFTTWRLVDAIKKTYAFSLWNLICINRRFGVMLACMFLSIAFLLTDIIVSAAHLVAQSGINPYWRFALVFKCASDTIFLDDFKSVLDDIVARKFSSHGVSARRTAKHYEPEPADRNQSFTRTKSTSLDTEASYTRPKSHPKSNSLLGKFRSWFSHHHTKSDSSPAVLVHAMRDKPQQPSIRQHSWDSEGSMLPRPPHTYSVYRNPDDRSDGSLVVARLS